MHLSGDPQNSIVNNIQNIVRNLTFSIGDVEILRLNRYDLYNSFKDLFLSGYQRDRMLFEGIQSANLRRYRVLPQSAPKTADTEAVIMAEVFGNRYRLYFNVIDFFKTPIYPYCIGQDILITLTLNEVKHIISTTIVKDENYELKNIHMEYETVTSKVYADVIREAYQAGTSILCTNVVLYREETVKKSDTLLNININVPRSSLKGVLMLFREEYADGVNDTEEFFNPKVEQIKITVEGMPNLVFSQNYKKYQQYSEICRYFKTKNPYVTVEKFYAGKNLPFL